MKHIKIIGQIIIYPVTCKKLRHFRSRKAPGILVYLHAKSDEICDIIFIRFIHGVIGVGVEAIGGVVDYGSGKAGQRSRRMVTGPSARSEICMSAPKRPVGTVRPSMRSSSLT